MESDDFDKIIDDGLLELSMINAKNDAINAMIKRLQENKKTNLAREERIRAEIEQVMMDSGVKSAQSALGAVSIVPVPPKVVVADEGLLLERYYRIKKEVNKSAIKKDMEAGISVDGACLSNGGLTLRVSLA